MSTRRVLGAMAFAIGAAGVVEAQVPGTLNFRDDTAARVVPTVAECDCPNMKAELAAGDFDRDGDPDVAIAIAGGTFGARRNKLYRNDGGVLFEVSGTAILPEFAGVDVSRNAAFHDVDGDGWLDLVLINDSYEFGDPNQLFMNRHPGGVFTHFEEEGALRGIGADWSCGAVARDVDGDGDVDVYTGNYGGLGQDELYQNDGAGFFALVTATHVPSEAHFTIDNAAADLNGDGKLDVTVANDDAPFWVYYNDLNDQGSGPGDYKYGAGGNEGRQSLGTSGGHGALEPGDFDGDGDVDLYWTNRHAPSDDRVLVNLGNSGDGKVVWGELEPPPYARGALSVKPTVADLDADGRPDVVLMTNGRPAVLRNTSVGGAISFVDWTPAPAFPAGATHAGAASLAFDSGGDGDLDLLLGAGAGDHLFEQVASVELDEDDLPGGSLPPFLDGEPLAVSGAGDAGESDDYAAGDLGSSGHLAVVLRGPDDYLLEVARDGGVVASSDRGGLGVEEALQLDLEAGSWSVRVTVLADGPTEGYVLELLARSDGPGGGAPENDDCEDATWIALGGTAFSNVGATTDGPPHAACYDFGDDQVPADVWFRFEAPAAGELTVSTCDTANYDTKIAVYAGTDCPVSDATLLGCNEDTPGCANFTSEVTVVVECGSSYTIRVGGWMGAQGAGTLVLTLDAELPVSSYCVAAPNSFGGGAVLSASGSTSVSANSLVLQAAGAIPGEFGIFYYGAEETLLPFGDGFRCVDGGALGLFRLAPAVQPDFLGDVSLALDLTQPPADAGPGEIAPGSTWKFQFWYRDPAGPGGSGFNLSDALSALFCP